MVDVVVSLSPVEIFLQVWPRLCPPGVDESLHPGLHLLLQGPHRGCLHQYGVQLLPGLNKCTVLQYILTESSYNLIQHQPPPS